MHDLKLIEQQNKHYKNFKQVPSILSPFSGYREAESAYLFDGPNLTPIFKRLAHTYNQI